MDESGRQQIVEANDAYYAAVDAHRAELDRIIPTWWHDEPARSPERTLDKQALKDLSALRKAMSDAEGALYEAIRRNS